jgi:N-acylneuraminate cytidylyltransferase
MILRNKKSHLSLVNGNKKKIFRRQQAPIVYDMTTVAYVSSPDFILNNHSIWDGTVDGVLIPKERAIDIDDSLDLLVAKNLYKNVKK